MFPNVKCSLLHFNSSIITPTCTVVFSLIKFFFFNPWRWNFYRNCKSVIPIVRVWNELLWVDVSHSRWKFVSQTSMFPEHFSLTHFLCPRTQVQLTAVWHCGLCWTLCPNGITCLMCQCTIQYRANALNHWSNSREGCKTSIAVMAKSTELCKALSRRCEQQNKLFLNAWVTWLIIILFQSLLLYIVAD